MGPRSHEERVVRQLDPGRGLHAPALAVDRRQPVVTQGRAGVRDQGVEVESQGSLDPEGLGDQQRPIDELRARIQQLDVDEPGREPGQRQRRLEAGDPRTGDQDAAPHPNRFVPGASPLSRTTPLGPPRPVRSEPGTASS